MSEHLDPVGSLLTHVSTPWTPARAEVVRDRIDGAFVRRRKVRGVSCALLVVAGFGAWFIGRGSGPANEIRFADGSIARLGGTGDHLEIVEESPSRTRVRLWGSAHFEVVREARRTFAVDAGTVTVQVLGTAFSVESRADRVRVSVDHGRVRVAWTDGERILTSGQADLFPPPDPGRAPTGVSAPQDVPAPAHARAPRTSGRWQRLAQNGRYDEAYLALETAIRSDGVRAVPDEPDSLLLAADAARLSRHPRAALPHLERVATRFRGDPRASLAAFTMGLVLLEELGRPADAARRFAQSRTLDPHGDLVEDALAREAEAHFKAGNHAGARSAADSYLRGYPRGRRANVVRRFGGLE